MRFGLSIVQNHSVVVFGQTFRASDFGCILGAPRDLSFAAIDRHCSQRGCSPSEPMK